MTSLKSFLRLLWTLVVSFSMTVVKLLSPFHSFVRSIVSQNPLIGRARGKGLGAVFSTWNGLNVIRSYNPTPQKSNSPAQLAQRSRFKLIQNMMSKCLIFVRKGFEDYQNGQTAFNEAMSRNIRNAVIGNFPNYDIDPSKIELADGSLIDLGEVSALDGGGNKLRISWTRTDAEGNGSVNDTIDVLVYNKKAAYAIVHLDHATRQMGELVVDIPADWNGEELWPYIKAGSELSGTVKSPSFPCGTVTMALI